MAVTINVNNLSLVHKDSGGVTINTLPDVCKTPPGPIPIPYPNIAYSKDLAKGTKTIEVDGGNMAANFGSEFSVSIGDEPGVAGGVKSGTQLKEATWITYSMDVFLEGKGACRLTDKMWMNHQNTVSMGGEMQDLVGAVGLDDTMQALCEIFCKVRKEGYDSKMKNPKKRFNYSSRAEELAKSYNGRLKNMVPERKMFVAISKATAKGRKLIKLATDAGRKVWTSSAIRNRLLKQFAKQAGVKVAKKAAKKAILKFIPIVNAVSLAWDVYDAAKLGIEAYNLVDSAMKNYDPAKYTTFEIRPDMTKLGPDGNPTDFYDFKFDRPSMTAEDGTKLGKYQDTFSEDQKQLYKHVTGKEPKPVDNETCKCKSP